MEVKVKVLKNGKEIESATRENQKLENQRQQEKLKIKGLRQPVADNVEVPEKDIEEMPMLIDAFDVDMCTIGSEGMLEILFKGKAFEIVHTPEAWKEIADAIKIKEDQKKASPKRCG